MAASRPVILALVGAALIAATFLATRGARESGGAEASAPDAQRRAAGPPADRPAHRPAPGAGRRTSPGRASAPSSQPTRAPRSPAGRTKGAAAGLPLPVARALSRNRVVILFLSQPGGADDAATARAVNTLRHHRRVSVFDDTIANLSHYRLLAEGLGVSRAPATVVVRAGSRPRLLEGYVDSESLHQHVSDLRR